jgi:hypothetical protein
MTVRLSPARQNRSLNLLVLLCAASAALILLGAS